MTDSIQDSILIPDIEDRGARIDKYLSQELEDISRSRIQKLLDDGNITVDGRIVKSNYKINGGENINVTVPELIVPQILPENIPLNIIYEDDDSKITPLFTDLDEFRKFYKDDDIQVLQNSFELYQNVLKTTDIEGYVLNPASEKYLFKKEFILAIENIPKTNFYIFFPYSEEELLNIKKSINNSNL